ncbi:dynein light chain roadblock-type 1 [Drosophila ficusphila]|uniref:dynein light chain roadblock-type 1 n=1 Tax=Drosophila ficusphila TaxID=30025 RepID=UPI0007E8B0BE|nr:dynein light chain roadblock-type 1 [Drosophila ficusphila]
MSRISRQSETEIARKTAIPQPTPKKSVPRDRSYDGDAFVNLFARRGARDVLILDNHGVPLRSTSSQRRTYLYMTNLKPLLFMARNVVRDLDPSNDITFMRIRSNINEIHMTLGSDFILIVIQKLRKIRKSVGE